MNEYGRDLAYIHHVGFSEFAESAAPGLLEILWKHGVRDGLVVELGCGSGILAHELTRAGFDVLGFDASPAMIALAREHSGGPAAGRQVHPMAFTSGESAPHPPSAPSPRRAGRRLSMEACLESLLPSVRGEGVRRADEGLSPPRVKVIGPAGGAPRFEVGAFEAITIPRCNAIVAMGEVLNYGTFAGVRKLVASADTKLLVFDIAERGAYPPYGESRVEGDDWSVIAIKESDGRHLTRRILTFRAEGDTMRRTEEVHSLELYDRMAMKALLREQGYRVQVRRSYGIWNGTRQLPKGHAVYVCVRP